VNNAAAVVLSILILFSSGCAGFRPGWVHENSFTIIQGETFPGSFDEDGNFIPENPDIEWTYKIPDISAGFIIDIESTLDHEDSLREIKFISPALQIELLEFDSHIPYVNTLKVDFGVAYQRTYLYIGKLWTSVFEISTGVYGGWNFEDREITFGIAGTIIKF
jgi:hypothetical protein